MSELSDASMVLLAIVQETEPVTPEEVENRAKQLAETGEIRYEGPKPDFTDSSVFGSAWNDLITKGYIRDRGSNESGSPLFENGVSLDALDEVCSTNKLSERQSFWSAIGLMG